ncbi:MAG: arsenate reductase (glutaredoxin) [Gammaproteobacteria bacterium]
MRDKLTIYQKPSCTKCRATLRLLEGKGVEFEAIDYYARPLTAQQLRDLLAKLNLSPRDILRRDEPVARELGINRREPSDDELIRLMIENPDLMQRPIVVRGDEAVLGRPPENVEKLL